MENNLNNLRHTLAHLLAAAVLQHYPHAKHTIGPAIDTGFYFDFDFGDGEKPTDEDLKKIQTTMRKTFSSWTSFEHKEVTAYEAREFYKGNQYKIELINEIEARGEKITLYTSGKYTDLCRGGHLENPAKEIDPNGFKLTTIAGAYWRGDEKNTMLTRIYGLAFATAADLDEYIAQIEEAKKRDHRKLGKELDLFTFSDLVGSGMPLWTPRGNTVRNAVVGYSRELNNKLGFGEVHTPNINKGELFKISGHYDQYKEDMLSVKSQYVEDEMFMKPMNCPQHTQIYASQMRSYRDLPIRYSDFANLYRDERPGELSGLTRLRAFAQDDGHVFCRPDQIEEEISQILNAIEEALKTYGISYWMRLSLRDPQKKEKYLGDDSVWENSQGILEKLLTEKGIEFKSAEGEAAFYGPKIDIMAVDALGRTWQISTVQLDFSMPSRFGLTYIDSDGQKKTPVMIHRALVGSPDRFIGILIEHYGGNFPLWLAPEQIRIVTVGEAHEACARTILSALKDAGIRAEMDQSDENLGKKIRAAKTARLPYFAVIGDKEVEAEDITLESRAGATEKITLAALVEKLTTEIKTKAHA
ncbi:threonine--tRNA ligase [Patescibacteria group bacterium]|nr:threonine--tRNA ligase [Patescibacteria group bacterium]